MEFEGFRALAFAALRAFRSGCHEVLGCSGFGFRVLESGVEGLSWVLWVILRFSGFRVQNLGLSCD